MRLNGSAEILLSLILVMLVIMLLNPFDRMTSTLLMTTQVVLVIIFSVFAGLVWKEHARDEREQYHRTLAGRVSFLAGLGVLVVGIIVQSIYHVLDPWLVIALSVMVLTKLGMLLYTNYKH